MSKFNQKQTLPEKLTNHSDATLNYEGAMAFALDAKTELITRVMTSFISEDKYYTKGKIADQDLQKAISNVLAVDPEFVLKTASFARNEMYMRSAPMFLLNEFANSGAKVPGSRKYASQCIQRADEINELMALSISTRKKKGNKSNFIKYGIRDALNKFDRYQFGKYNRDGTVKFRDSIFITHPAPKTEAQQLIFDDLVNDNLESPDTWEVALSTKGASKEVWEDLLARDRVPFMAMLRNLNNCIKWDVNLEPVIKMLTNPVAVRKSKQFPFRFFSAYKALQQERNTGKNITPLLDALNKAMELSIENLPKLPGKTLVLIDVSGSMSSGKVSEKSSVTYSDISCLFGAISTKICEQADLFPFACNTRQVFYSSTNGILDIMEKIRNANVGCSTYAYLPMEVARQQKIKYDRVILFSDMQCYGGSSWMTGGQGFATSFIQYQNTVNPAYLYSVDLAGYGTTQVPKDNKKVCTIAGWSEKILSFIPMFESESATMVKTIEEYSHN
jgi:hypothetical protein